MFKGGRMGVGVELMLLWVEAGVEVSYREKVILVEFTKNEWGLLGCLRV